MTIECGLHWCHARACYVVGATDTAMDDRTCRRHLALSVDRLLNDPNVSGRIIVDPIEEGP